MSTVANPHIYPPHTSSSEVHADLRADACLRAMVTGLPVVVMGLGEYLKTYRPDSEELHILYGSICDALVLAKEVYVWRGYYCCRVSFSSFLK